jgi:hypothetical protein
LRCRKWTGAELLCTIWVQFAVVGSIPKSSPVHQKVAQKGGFYSNLSPALKVFSSRGPVFATSGSGVRPQFRLQCQQIIKSNFIKVSMEQKRKIIIPVGGDPPSAIPAPHFDAEATLSAQPVVPLKEPAAPSPYNDYLKQRNARAAAAPWKRSTLILIVLAAIGVGVASGLAIGFYESRGKANAPAAAQPAASESQQAATQPRIEPTQSQPAKQTEPEPEAQLPAAPPEPEAQKDSSDETQSAAENQKEDREKNRQSARDNPKQTEERVPPPVVRDDPASDPVADEREARRERRERRREERRRQREDDNLDPLNVPRNIKRARQEINRIRDIFEGPQQ